MNRRTRIATIGALALTLGACSQQQAVQTQDQINAAFVNALHNIGATACSPTTIASALANVPTMFLTSAQLSLAINFGCSSLFGITPAPVTAPGNNPIFAPPPAAPAAAK